MIKQYMRVSILFLSLCSIVLTLPHTCITARAQAQNTTGVQNKENNVENQEASPVESPQTTEQSTNESRESQQPPEEDNSLFATVKKGGKLMIFLIILGVIALGIIIERIIYIIRNRIWDISELETYLKEAAETSQAKFREDKEDELRNAFQIYANDLEKGMGLLSGIGNLSPIVGFLGTVIGMIAAFSRIAAATTVNAKVVAVGIQIALITTAGGLIVAAPTLAFYYLLVHIVQNRYARSEELIQTLCEDLPRISQKLLD